MAFDLFGCSWRKRVRLCGKFGKLLNVENCWRFNLCERLCVREHGASLFLLLMFGLSARFLGEHTRLGWTRGRETETTREARERGKVVVERMNFECFVRRTREERIFRREFSDDDFRTTVDRLQRRNEREKISVGDKIESYRTSYSRWAHVAFKLMRFLTRVSPCTWIVSGRTATWRIICFGLWR